MFWAVAQRSRHGFGVAELLRHLKEKVDPVRGVEAERKIQMWLKKTLVSPHLHRIYQYFKNGLIIDNRWRFQAFGLLRSAGNNTLSGPEPALLGTATNKNKEGEDGRRDEGVCRDRTALHELSSHVRLETS